MIADANEYEIKEEKVVLEKFEGEPSPENLIERLHIINGEIVKLERFENGEVTLSLDKDGAAVFTNPEPTPLQVKEEN